MMRQSRELFQKHFVHCTSERELSARKSVWQISDGIQWDLFVLVVVIDQILISDEHFEFGAF